jgi:transcription termination factor Rho
MRNVMSNMNTIEVIEELTKRMKASKSNKDFLKQMEFAGKE